MPTPPDFQRPPFRKDRPKSNRLRTAAIVAGGTGLAYGGLKLGQAAEQVRHTAQIAAGAADNTRAITGAIRSPLRTLRKAVRLSVPAASLRKDVIHFREQPRKENPAAVMGISSALTGGLLGGIPVAIRRGGTLRSVVKAAGTGAALGGALGTGSALIGTKVLGAPKQGDGAAYAKRGAVGGALGGAALGGAAVLALRKVPGAPVRALVKASKTFHPAQWIRKAPLPAAVGIGAAGAGAAGAFQGADEGSGVDTLRAIKKPRQFSAEAEAHGTRGGRRTGESIRTLRFDAPLTGKLAADRYRKRIQDDDLDRRDANTARSAVAGSVAGLLAKSSKLSRLKRAGLGALAGAGGVAAVRAATDGTKDYYGERSRGAKGAEKLPAVAGLGAAAVLAGKRLRVFRTRDLRKDIQFGGRQQLRDETNRYVDPLKVASGEASAVGYDHMPVQHAQVVRAAINKGQSIHRTGTRVGALLKDAVGAASGQPKVDARGRTQKREWEKSWFKNAVGTAATAGALLGHASLMKKNPAYRKRVAGVVKKGKTAANQVVPDLFPMSARIIDVEVTVERLAPGMIQFDETAPSWDVRDERGRSARVFAPGSRRRERREKKPHETVGFLRKAAVAGAVLAAAGGGMLGYRLGTRRAALRKLTPAAPSAKVIPFPAQA